jgi:hypothetical protein
MLIQSFIQLKVWWHDFCLFVYFIVHTFIPSHSYSSHSPKFLSIFSSLVSSVGKTSLGCRAENQTRACLTASRRTTNWANPHPFWATPNLTELRRTLTELRITLSELRRNFTEPPRYIILYLKPPSFHIALMLRKCKGRTCTFIAYIALLLHVSTECTHWPQHGVAAWCNRTLDGEMSQSHKTVRRQH